MTHCWEDLDIMERLNLPDPEVGRTCLLPAGHDEPHEWTRDGEIMVEFSKPNASPFVSYDFAREEARILARMLGLSDADIGRLRDEYTKQFPGFAAMYGQKACDA